MSIDGLFGGMSVSASGMAAQRARMNVIAANIAHAQDTDRGDGKAYVRKEVVFETVLDEAGKELVRVSDVAEDVRTPMERIHAPGHPDSDKDGYVTMPNVSPVFEMTDLVSASRSYEANLQVSRMLKDMAERALELGR